MQSRLQTSLARWLSRQPSGGVFRGDGFSLGTQKGPVRGENQDRVAVAKFFPHDSSQEFLLGILSDGMGGMQAGARCAELVVSTFMSAVLGRFHIGIPRAMLEAAELANQAVFSEFRGDGGATLSAIAVHGDVVCAVNVGDSRIYSLRANNTIVQESQDDTVSSRLAALGEASENARAELLQYIGMGPDLSPHLLTGLGAEHIRGILLTSDGAHSVAQAVLSGIAVNAQFPRDLIDRLLSVSLWLGGKDNATALALTFQRRQQQQVLKGHVLKEALVVFGPAGEREFPLEYLCDTVNQSGLVPSARNSHFHEGNPEMRNTVPPSDELKFSGVVESSQTAQPELLFPLPPEESTSESSPSRTESVGREDATLPSQTRRSRRKNRTPKNSTLPEFVIEDVSDSSPQNDGGADSDTSKDPLHNHPAGKGKNS